MSVQHLRSNAFKWQGGCNRPWKWAAVPATSALTVVCGSVWRRRAISEWLGSLWAGSSRLGTRNSNFEWFSGSCNSRSSSLLDLNMNAHCGKTKKKNWVRNLIHCTVVSNIFPNLRSCSLLATTPSPQQLHPQLYQSCSPPKEHDFLFQSCFNHVPMFRHYGFMFLMTTVDR